MEETEKPAEARLQGDVQCRFCLIWVNAVWPKEYQGRLMCPNCKLRGLEVEDARKVREHVTV